MSAAPSNLTGVWQGFYTYPGGIGSVGFGATLIEVGSTITGSTHEPGIFPTGVADMLYATLLGSREGAEIAFVKTYDGRGGWSHSVHYTGTLTEDHTEIEGTWMLRGDWSGRVLMIRSTGRAVEAARKRFERI